MRVPARVKRVYDPVEPGDGYRALVDHVWPRGVSRERASLDAWLRDLAPSGGLRKWFDHDPSRFGEFRARYREELAAQRETLGELRRAPRREPSRFFTPRATGSTTTAWSSPNSWARSKKSPR